MDNLARRRTYSSWYSMKDRCYNERCNNFKNYGARGILVCDSWLFSFEHFLADMGYRPEGLTLERINNDGGYQPDNCRWATRAEQRVNQRTCNYLELDGERKPLRLFAREYGISEATLYQRLKRGMSVREALTTPISTFNSMGAKAMLGTRWKDAIAGEKK